MNQTLPSRTSSDHPPDVHAASRTDGVSLADLAAMARRHLLLIVASAVASLFLALSVTFLMTPQFRASVDILVDPQVLQVVGRGLTRSDSSPSIDLANVDSQASVFLSTPLLRTVVDDLKLRDDPAFARAVGTAAATGTDAPILDALRERLVVRRVDNSLVFQVIVSHPMAEQAARIANAIAATYLRQAQSQRNAAVRKAGGSLIDQSAELRQQLNRAETAVERFKSEKGLVSSGQAGLLVNQQLTQLATQISAANADLARIGARQEISRRTPEQVLADASPEVMLSPTIASLKTQLARLAEEEAQLSQSLGANHPQLVSVRTQRAAVRRLMVGEIERTRQAMDEEARRARANLAALKQREADLTKSQSASNEQEIRLRQLESEADAVRTVYNASLGRVKELEQQQGIDTNNSRIVSDAVAPARASGAPKSLVAIAALMFGTVLGLAIAFAREWATGTLASVGAIRRATGLPVLARLGAGGEPVDRAALLRVARALRRTLGPRLPALVIVTGPGDGPARRRVADALTGILRDLGEPVLRGSQIASSGRSELLPEASPAPSLPPGMVRRRPATPASSRQPVPATPEFVIVDVDPNAPDDLVGALDAADAVFLACRPGYVRRGELQRLAGILDDPAGGGNGLQGIVCLDGAARPAWRPSGSIFEWLSGWRLDTVRA